MGPKSKITSEKKKKKNKVANKLQNLPWAISEITSEIMNIKK